MFLPQFRELPPPALDLFDLDEQFSSCKTRLAQLTNKCKNRVVVVALHIVRIIALVCISVTFCILIYFLCHCGQRKILESLVKGNNSMLVLCCENIAKELLKLV